MLHLSAADLAGMRTHSECAWPEEACGFLLGKARADGLRKDVVEAKEAANQKQGERERRYIIEPAQLLAAEEDAERRGLDIVGFYHSHPNGVPRPSDFDRDHAWPWYSYVIVAVSHGKAGELTSWQLAEDRSSFNPEEIVQIAPQGIEPQ